MITTRHTVPQQLAQMDRDRLRAYREHLDFYNGLQWPSSRRRERRLTFNYVRAFIDKLAAYMTEGMTVTAEPWDASPESRERAQRARAALDAVAESNALAQLDHETEVDASILGDGCYKVTWDPEAETVRITTPDVQGVFAWWVGDDFSANVAGSQPLPPDVGGGGGAARRDAPGVGGGRGRGVDGADLQPVAGRPAAGGAGEPLRRHPFRPLPEPA